ncbi:putative 2-oxoglutarate/Fe(II)-dependent dioxygenase YbiX/peroxiredoxin [Caulobacter ginsengisoli]|uniref:2-oxoglutarate/Fe(II)-dependent dioxygenase YbiX/peroxiredoxin n=1 Tax=Caulobacter ginsengisoli TaxID=400775 RepID=A0ABU0IRF6_9CAUL|nr:2OG-Fe(II) oxygenase [Caulobacter ginsengisoli]MDQ0463936.1 putative 2-oxoglutarate/Fe(II)-dependent dioxygenase YbiX/peroxiredoxin [Caulobacter ginsengisoli]
MPLTPGDLAPSFRAPTPTNPRYVFNSAAGRYIALAFLPAREDKACHAALSLIRARRALFDDVTRAFFGVITDPDVAPGAVDEIPGIRWFLDVEREVTTLFEITEPSWIVLDPSMRVILTAPLDKTEVVLEHLSRLAPIDLHAGVPLHAPVLIAPRIFEPAFCKRLLDYYDAQGGTPSGFMREVDGRTVLARDESHKRRSDATIEDEALMAACRARISRRLSPLITQAFQFVPTRIERYIVACYDADSGGWFRPHRDNTTKGTAHRKFAVSINLNAEEFEGGDLRFPEFGSRTYRPPTGGAVVFSCSLLHEATPVTSGRRFAFLPFLYDEDGAKIREANNAYLDPALSQYTAAPAQA